MPPLPGALAGVCGKKLLRLAWPRASKLFPAGSKWKVQSHKEGLGKKGEAIVAIRSLISMGLVSH